MKKRKAEFLIVFYGYNNKIERLVERFNELEHKQSVQIMGGILKLNSFESEELNQLNYGTPNDFGLFQCQLYMENYAIRIYCNVGQPNEFISNVCAKYKVNGVIENKYGKELIKSDSEGNFTYLIESERNKNWYKKDREDFLKAALIEVRSNTLSGWNELKRTYDFLSEEDFMEIRTVFIEENIDGLF